MRNGLIAVVLLFSTIRALASCGDGVVGMYTNRVSTVNDGGLVLIEDGKGCCRSETPLAFVFKWRRKSVDGRKMVYFLTEKPAGVIIGEHDEALGRILWLGTAKDMKSAERSEYEHVPEGQVDLVTFFKCADAPDQCAFRKMFDKAAARMKEREDKASDRQRLEKDDELRKHEEMIRRAKLSFELFDYPESILDVELVYTAPHENDRWPSDRFLADTEMSEMFCCVTNPFYVFPEEVLLQMLDKIDWVRGGILAMAIMNRKEMTTQSRARLTPRVLSIVGRVNDMYLTSFFEDQKTPLWALEKALELKKLPKDLKPRLKDIYEQRTNPKSEEEE